MVIDDAEKQEFLQVVKDAYYLNSEVIRFLLAENLALKTLLHEKGLISPEEYKICRERADTILEAKARAQMAAQIAALLKQDSSECDTEVEVHGK